MPEEHAQAIMAVLTEVSWDGDITLCRASRDQLCDFFGLPRPKLKVKSTSSIAAKTSRKDELDSYKGRSTEK